MNHFLQELIERYPELQVCVEDVERACLLMTEAFRAGGKLLVCGNGGSAADSEHIVGELMKGFMLKRPISKEMRQHLIAQYGEEGNGLADSLQGALPALSLNSQTSLLTAYGNDVANEMIFAQQVWGYGKPWDILLAISTSGNSKNVLQAVKIARAMGLTTIGLTGLDGGAMKRLCELTIRVPYVVTPEIQERHLPIYHTLCKMLEEEFFGHDHLSRD